MEFLILSRALSVSHRQASRRSMGWRRLALLLLMLLPLLLLLLLPVLLLLHQSVTSHGGFLHPFCYECALVQANLLRHFVLLL